MKKQIKILAFSGSTRTGSFNKKLVKIAADAAMKIGAEVTLIDLNDFQMPLYDGDLEKTEGIPENAKKIRDLFHRHQGLLISSPEYNSSLSGVLKNVIDWVSRPVSGEVNLSCFVDKTACIMSASPGALGGIRGLASLRSILGNIKVTVLPNQISIPDADKAFDEQGKLKDEKHHLAVEEVGIVLVKIINKLNRD